MLGPPASPTPHPHPQTANISKALVACAAFDITWQGDVFRVASVLRSNSLDLVSGEGSRRCGGRWNPPGLFPTVYFSLDLSTATDEYVAQNRRRNIPDSESTPFVVTSASLHLSKVLDLTSRSVRSALNVSRKRMVAEPWGIRLPESISQAIGRIAYGQAYQGLLVPSAIGGKKRNIVVFPDRLSPGQLSVNQADQLPRTQGHGEAT